MGRRVWDERYSFAGQRATDSAKWRPDIDFAKDQNEEDQYVAESAK